MKKLILSIAFIFGLNLAQAQDKLDTSDFFQTAVSQAAKDLQPVKYYIGTGDFDHSSSIGKLKNIFNDNGESFREIFGQMPEEFQGVVYANDMSVPYIKLDDYFKRSIKDHSYDSLSYSEAPSKYINENGKLILVERETINCFNASKERVRFIQISRYNGEIVHVLDNCSDLK